MDIPDITLYGIPHCDTVKKARAWLVAAGVPHRFHDFRRDGLPPARLDEWLAQVGWEVLVNRRGTTWRQLPPETRDAVTGPAGARAALLAHPSLVKRPVVEWGPGPSAGLTVGFDPQTFTAALRGRHTGAPGAAYTAPAPSADGGA